MPPRILTRSERQAMEYQSQGSFPNGALVLNTYSLDDTLVFAASTTTYDLFGSTKGQSSKWLTNMTAAGMVPGGQSMMVFGMSLALDISEVAAADLPATLNQFYSNMRSAIFTFARNNEDFSAQVRGSKFLPPISYVGSAIAPTLALDHVGDFSRTAMIYKFLSPIVIGQNTGFSVTAEFENAPTDDLIGVRMQVFLDGGLTKKQTA